LPPLTSGPLLLHAMILLLLLFFSTVTYLILLCSKNKPSSNNPSPCNSTAAKQRPPKELLPPAKLISATPPDSPQRSNRAHGDQGANPLDPTKGVSPSNTGTGTGRLPSTPGSEQNTGAAQGAAKPKDQISSPSNEKKENSMYHHSQETGDLLMTTLTAGPDSIFEKGL
ncbi:hypothetical protein PFISCL1PPCAC_22263, partial [Pristionchus fissidentatus]